MTEKIPPKLHTIKEAARLLGTPYRQLLESINNSAIPYYQVGKCRRLVCLTEVLAFIKYETKGGSHD